MASPYASWLGQAVVLKVAAGVLRVPLRGIILGESEDAVWFRIRETWDVLIRLAPLGTTTYGLWVAAGHPVREVSGGGHHCPTWRRRVLDKAIVVGADRRS